MEAIGEFVITLIGYGVLYVLTGGKRKPTSNSFAEFVVGLTTVMVAMMLVAGGFVLYAVATRPQY